MTGGPPLAGWPGEAVGQGIQSANGCTEVCPAGIKITENAIIPMKERAAAQRYDPLGRVLRSRRHREGRKSAS
jgi:hypothetical protein